jgi:hypothetical protein
MTVPNYKWESRSAPFPDYVQSGPVVPVVKAERMAKFQLWRGFRMGLGVAVLSAALGFLAGQALSETISISGIFGQDTVTILPPDGVICRPSNCSAEVMEGFTGRVVLLEWLGGLK